MAKRIPPARIAGKQVLPWSELTVEEWWIGSVSRGRTAETAYTNLELHPPLLENGFEPGLPTTWAWVDDRGFWPAEVGAVGA